MNMVFDCVCLGKSKAFDHVPNATKGKKATLMQKAMLVLHQQKLLKQVYPTSNETLCGDKFRIQLYLTLINKIYDLRCIKQVQGECI